MNRKYQKTTMRGHPTKKPINNGARLARLHACSEYS